MKSVLSSQLPKSEQFAKAQSNFHTDAVQAAGYVKINVQEQNIDMLSMTAHKLHGPKGIGLLYVRRGIRLENLIDGGAQERNKRAGTEMLRE